MLTELYKNSFPSKLFFFCFFFFLIDIKCFKTDETLAQFALFKEHHNYCATLNIGMVDMSLKRLIFCSYFCFIVKSI